MSTTRDNTLTQHDPSKYSKHANFVYSAKYTTAVLDLLGPQRGERIADLGCGTGQLTETIRGHVGEGGEVVGIDSNSEMLAKARKSVSSEDITYLQADIQDYRSLPAELEGTFDAVFSSATFHWCKANPGGVVDTIKWLLKPGGRVAFEFGGFGNTVGVRAALYEVLRRRGVDPLPLDPWYFPTAEQQTALLKAHGLTPGEVALYPRPTPLPTDLVGWLQTFTRTTFFAGYAEEEAVKMMHEVADICRPDAYWNNAYPGTGADAPASSENKEEGSEKTEGWEIMYVRLRGSARKQ